MSVTFVEALPDGTSRAVRYQPCFAALHKAGYMLYAPDGSTVPNPNAVPGSYQTYMVTTQAYPDSIRYVARVDLTVTRSMAEAYVTFLTALFPGHVTGRVLDYVEADHVDAAPVPPKGAPVGYGCIVKPQLIILWDVITKALPRPRSLLYLTACRYVDEYSKVVIEWHRRTQAAAAPLDLEAQFTAFQEIHVESIEGTLAFGYSYSGHGLMQFTSRTAGAAGWGSTSYGPITLATLNERLVKGTDTVLNHFAGPIPAPKPVVVGVIAQIAAPVFVAPPVAQVVHYAHDLDCVYVPPKPFAPFVYDAQTIAAARPVQSTAACKARPSRDPAKDMAMTSIAALKRAIRPRAPRVIKAVKARA